jgi:hypothetical protein
MKLENNIWKNMENNFVVFIITHGRPDKQITLKTLKRCNYSGPYFLICDNEDKTRDEYVKKYPQKVIIFDKKYYADQVDEGNNFDNRRTTTHARNACFDIAKKLKKKYFVVFDDDYGSFLLRYENGSVNTKNIDRVFQTFIDFMIKVPNCLSITFSQGGDHIGGFCGTQLKRKAMNSFFCDVDRPFQFLGQLNEDVNAYVIHGSRGGLFFTFTSVQLCQAETQKTSGGMTEAYLQYGTYCKSFTTVMMMPNSVRVVMLNTTNKRLHHQIDWKHTVPMIISDKYKNLKPGDGGNRTTTVMEKNNSGSLFKNLKKVKEQEPDYTGKAFIDQKDYKIAAWVNKSKSGTNYMRLLFTENKSIDLNSEGHQQSLKMGTGTSEGSVDSIMIDDLPF